MCSNEQTRLIIGAAGLALATGAAQAEGTLDQRIDAPSDQPVATALTREEGEGRFTKDAGCPLRRPGPKVFVRFQQYLGDKPVPVRVRADRQSVLSDRWDVSPAGTEVFAHERVSLARDLAKGGTFTGEATTKHTHSLITSFAVTAPGQSQMSICVEGRSRFRVEGGPQHSS